VFFKLLRFSVMPWLLRNTVQRKKLTILIFHNPRIETFHLTLKVLKRKYNVISLEEATKQLKQNKLEPRSVVITFDDGWKENAFLLQLMEQFKIPTTIFLCTDFIDSNMHFWFSQIPNNSKKSAIKKLPDEDRISFFNQNDINLEKDFGLDNRQVLSKEEIFKMHKSGFVDFQSHTCSHPILDRCSKEKSFSEINRSKAILENLLDKKIYAFAYPNGNYSEREISHLKESEYEVGFTIKPGYNSSYTNPYELYRFGIPENAKEDEIVVRVSGLSGMLLKIKMKFKK
jgi:peptidoglycan/xylan/chitin deacetylase (PgdA/CDA1 family)